MDDRLRAAVAELLQADKVMRDRLWQAMRTHGPASPEYTHALEEATETARRNTATLMRIIEEHGWLGASAIGREAAIGLFLVLQHAELEVQLKCLPLVQRAVDVGELEGQALALLEDRIRIRQGRPQLYGSQIRSGADGKPELHSIEDEANVDRRRASLGLPPLAEYLERAGVPHLRRRDPS